ncbi:putative MFS family arabinose efflux permease [Streptacidiphilus sp. MAP12-33]|uniref:MFS transporter n=1 Tax=Streptacidiphilus sp. MAP12-33 TaxID=3156266 RepID=UPI003512E391
MSATLRRGELATTAFACGVAVAGLYYAQPLLPALTATFHAGRAGAADVVSAGQLGYAAGLLLVVPLGDRLPRERLAITLLWLAVPAAVLAALSPTLPVLALAAVWLGVCGSAAQVLVARTASTAGPERRGRAVGTAMGGLTAGILLARVLSGQLAAAAGWRATYAAAAVLPATAAVLLGATLRHGAQPHPRAPAERTAHGDGSLPGDPAGPAPGGPATPAERREPARGPAPAAREPLHVAAAAPCATAVPLPTTPPGRPAGPARRPSGPAAPAERREPAQGPAPAASGSPRSEAAGPGGGGPRRGVRLRPAACGRDGGGAWGGGGGGAWGGGGLWSRRLAARCASGFAVFAAFSAFWTPSAYLLAGPPFRLGEAATGLFGLAGLAGVLLAQPAGRLCDHGHARPARFGAHLLMVVAFLPLALGRGNLVLLGVGAVLLDLGLRGVQTANQQQIYAQLPAGTHSRVTTVYMTCYFAGGATGSALSAAVWAHAGWPGVCLLGGVLAALPLLPGAVAVLRPRTATTTVTSPEEAS